MMCVEIENDMKERRKYYETEKCLLIRLKKLMVQQFTLLQGTTKYTLRFSIIAMLGLYDRDDMNIIIIYSSVKHVYFQYLSVQNKLQHTRILLLICSYRLQLRYFTSW